ncbi:MAG: hypothetical protein M3O02_03525 [Acidobacteriota bacterium]|nr:hypothetical protein [Acidobacteriota bacterium]
MNRNPNDPNKGMNTRKFLISVCVALVLMFVVAFFVVGTNQRSLLHGTTHPKPTSAATPE